nr:PAS domain-containing protein [Rhodovibrio sodomensis]
MPEQAEILAYWTGLGGPGRLPARRDIDPVAIPRLLRHLMMLDVLGPPLDFRYRLLGDEIMLRARPGLKGRRFSEIAGKGPGSGVWESARKVAETGLPRYGRVGYIGPDQFTAGVINLLMPLSDDGHTISQVLLLVLFCQRDLQAPDDRPV